MSMGPSVSEGISILHVVIIFISYNYKMMHAAFKKIIV